MKKAFTLFVFLCLSVASFALDRPKVVVGIIVDQMRWDYLYRFWDDYTEGGFRRLMSEGYNVENTLINYVPSITAVGHTSVYTGSVPSIHGIASNSFYVDGKYVYATYDENVKPVGCEGKNGMQSPHNLLTTTIGDELKIATDFKARVYGVSVKDRAAILPAGSGADGAFWINGETGQFITSSYYMDALPEWVKKFNKGYGKHSGDEVWNTPLGDELVANMAKAVLKNEELGKRGTTDMLCVSFSITDGVGHRFGTHDPLTRKIYVDLDERLQDLFQFLDTEYGKDEYLVFLTADHGAHNGIKTLRDRNITAGGYNIPKHMEALTKHLQEHFNKEFKPVERTMDYKVCLSREEIKRAGLTYDEVKQEAVRFLNSLPDISYAVDLENAANAPIPYFIREKVINGYNQHRGGDIEMVVLPGHYFVWEDDIKPGTTHGTWSPFDAHIPFLLMGHGVKHGTTQKQAYITDIAPTVCALLHIQSPNGTIGKSVIE